MKRFAIALLVLCLMVGMRSIAPSEASAAELLDVNPQFTGGVVTVEITADIPMTYSFYKVPGQARAVVDIADADPEKVEPLIVVNKGAVSSISVDKAQISGMVVSRIIFNLVSEMEPRVTPAADRKKLVVTFGGGSPVPATPVPTPAPPAVPQPPTEEQKPKAVVPPSSPPAAPAPSTAKEDDPLGLDEPAAADQKTAAAAPSAAQPAKQPAPVPEPRQKIQPVVPMVASGEKPVLRGIVIGKGHIDLKANGQITQFKTLRLTAPERLVIDIAGAKSSMAAKVVTINSLGLSKARIGMYPTHLRVVFDASKAVLPPLKVVPTDSGLRISPE